MFTVSTRKVVHILTFLVEMVWLYSIIIYIFQWDESFLSADYVTTLIESRTYPKQALAKLYQQRWNIEVNFRTIKTDMGMDMLRCKTAVMVKKEIAVNLLTYNLIRANLARAACLNDKQPRYLSFMATVQLMRNTASLCITATGTTLKRLISPLLIAMAQTHIGQ